MVYQSAIGPVSIIIILIVALLIFGPKNLPKLGSAAGKTIRAFKKETADIMEDIDRDPTKK